MHSNRSCEGRRLYRMDGRAGFNRAWGSEAAEFFVDVEGMVGLYGVADGPLRSDVSVDGVRGGGVTERMLSSEAVDNEEDRDGMEDNDLEACMICFGAL